MTGGVGRGTGCSASAFGLRRAEPRPARRALCLAACALLVGCAPRGLLRASAGSFLKSGATRVSVEAGPEVVEEAVVRLLLQRGATLVDREVAPSGATFATFKGPRGSPVQGLALGSLFAVRLASAPLGTEVTVLGKPTVEGREPCSEEDGLLEELRYRCLEVVLPEGFEGLAQLSGREEALVVSWLLAALERAFARVEPTLPQGL